MLLTFHFVHPVPRARTTLVIIIDLVPTQARLQIFGIRHAPTGQYLAWPIIYERSGTAG